MGVVPDPRVETRGYSLLPSSHFFFGLPTSHFLNCFPEEVEVAGGGDADVVHGTGLKWMGRSKEDLAIDFGGVVLGAADILITFLSVDNHTEGLSHPLL